MPTPCTIYAFCNNCGESHTTFIGITVSDELVADVAVGHLYDGREVPATFAMLANNTFPCPKTGKQFIQKDNKQIFLVPDKRPA